MTLKKLFASAATAGAMALSTGANAFIIDSGPIQIDYRIALVDGVQYGEACSGVAVADSAPLPACNDAAQNPATASFVSPDNIGRGDAEGESDDTWAIFEIDSIFNPVSGQEFYEDGQESYDLVGIIYGIVDREFNGTQVFSEGGSVEVRRVDPITFGAAVANPSDRTAYNAVTGVISPTDPLWLSANFILSNNFTDPVGTAPYTFSSNAAATGTTVGNSGGILEVTGGERAGNFDILDLNVNLRTSNSGSFLFRGDGNAEGTAIPAPGTLALFGLALAGLGASRRLRK